MKLILFTPRINRNKKFAALLLSVQVSIVLVCWFQLQSNSFDSFSLTKLYKSIDVSVNQSMQRTRKTKHILIWNSAHRIETAAFGSGHEPFVQNGCEVQECVVHDNVSSSMLLQDYDAVIVHMHELWLTQLPSNLTDKQRLIFLTQESPASMPLDVTQLNNTFNWIMSYRIDSDVQLRYGHIEPDGPTIPQTRLPSNKNYAANKTRPVAWMASRCDSHSLRETYVHQLSKYIPIDIYGGCGNLTCARNGTHWLSYPECYDMLQEKYKFYLSFENSICTDYVTEKFFEIINHDIVPIVYGGANYSRIAPPHSYINALDFTPQKLAQYVKVLDGNDALYNEYFWWKDHYQVEAGVQNMARHGFCDLCKKLHQDEGIYKIYPQLITEWHSDNQCRSVVSWDTNDQ